MKFNVIGQIVVLEFPVLQNRILTSTPYCLLIGNGTLRCHKCSPATRVLGIGGKGNTAKSGDAG